MSEISTALWINEPTILFNTNYILELWPFEDMEYASKINAITRMIIVLTLVGFLITESIYIICVCAVSLLFIFLLASQHTKLDIAEPFSNPPEKYQSSTPSNPMGNVLLTDIGDNPNKLSAPPSYEPKNIQKIDNNIQQFIKNENSGNEAITDNDDLWKRFGDNRFNQIFYSTANTKIVNDRESLGKFLYGDMPSSKEDGVNGALMRTKNNERYQHY